MYRLRGIAVALVIVLGWLSCAEAKGSPFGRKDFGSPFFSKYVAPPPKHGPLDFLDKLYNKLDHIKGELKTATEYLDGLEAQLGLLRKQVREIVLITVTSLNVTESNQNDLLDDIESHLDSANASIEAELLCLLNITDLNSENILNASEVLTILAKLRHRDAVKEGRVVALNSLVNDFKSKLFQVTDNHFKIFKDKVEDVSGELSNIHECESKRMCETGVVILSPDDRRAEYLYQNSYAFSPAVSYGISSYVFQLDTRPEPAPSFGSYIPWQEPSELGVFVIAIPSLTGVTFQMFDKTFGDPAIQRVAVSFSACSIGAGLEIVH